jgi:hypothetical protein
MNELTADDIRPKAQRIHFDFPVEIVDGAVCDDRENHVETLGRNLLEAVDGGDEGDSFTTNDSFAFTAENFDGVFLEVG